jgi:hypothetical protein
MVPKVGLIVHYIPNGRAEETNSAPYHPAVITRVWGTDENACVNLKVLPDCGQPFDRTSVCQGARSAEPTPGSWYWPQ